VTVIPEVWTGEQRDADHVEAAARRMAGSTTGWPARDEAMP
jgi:hypothetical protein